MSGIIFTREGLRAGAEAKAGADDYGSDSYMAALEPLLYSVEHEAHLNELGRYEISRRIVAALANRLTLVAWEKANPELAAAPVEAPLFILGLPRTGSSILHETLSAAPGVRTLLNWEVRDFSLVHAVTDAHDDARVQAIGADLALKNEMVPGYAAIHYEDAHTPVECLTLTITDLVSTQFATVIWAPTYRKFLLSQDARSAYQWHRRALRFLQAKGPKANWVLKAPMHSLYLDALTETYPDAKLIQTHRDPAAVMGSQCSLYATLRRAWSDDVPVKEQAPGDVAYTAEMVQRAVDFRRAHPDIDARICDVAFKDFMGDRETTLARIYAHFGIDFTPEVRDAMLGYLDHRPREKYGKHSYSLSDFGLSVESLVPKFADYTTHYSEMV